MTNDRAVEIMKAIIFMLGRDDYTDEVEEAIHMAIEALEREACADESTCNDLATNLQPSKQDADDTISRAAAIKAIDVKNVNKGIISALQSIIEELPSAQPETHEERTETHACDCIERQAAIDAIRVASGYCHPSNVAKELAKLPPVEPERKFTDRELKVFAHGISLKLLSKKSAQHWHYEDKTAEEIEFLEGLYEKVKAEMEGEE